MMPQTLSDSHLFEKRRQNACVFSCPALVYCLILCQKTCYGNILQTPALLQCVSIHQIIAI